MNNRFLVTMIAILCLSLAGFGCASKKTAARDVQAQQAQEKAQQDAAASELTAKIYFDFDKHALKPEARTILTRKAELMQQFPQLKLTLEGHSDEQGDAAYNMALGERRARAAADFLVKQGVAASRITVVSYGKDRPQDPSHTPAARAKNRFVEFKANY